MLVIRCFSFTEIIPLPTKEITLSHQNNTSFYRFLIVFSITPLSTVYFCFNDILREICLVSVLEQYIWHYFGSLFLCKSNHFQL